MLTDLQARCVRLRDAMTGQSSASSPDSGDERDLRGKHSRIPIVLFAVAITFYCVYLALVQSSWVLGGGMWAEMASNYYPNSISDSLWTRLFATDFGYVPLPQRLIGIVGSSFNLPAAAIPYFYTWSAVILTGAMVGSFCLRPFGGTKRRAAFCCSARGYLGRRFSDSDLHQLHIFRGILHRHHRGPGIR